MFSCFKAHCTQYFAMSKQINEKCEPESHQKCSFAITNTFTQVTPHSWYSLNQILNITKEFS